MRQRSLATRPYQARTPSKNANLFSTPEKENF